MAQLGSTTITGNISASQAAALSTHLVRYGELVTLLAGKSNTGHTHIIGDITGFASGVRGIVEETVGVASGLVHQADLDALLALKSNVGHTHVIGDIVGFGSGVRAIVLEEIGDTDGLVFQADLDAQLALKSDVGHTHFATQILGFNSAVFSGLRDTLVQNTQSIGWTFGALQISADLIRKSGGLIEVDADGVYLKTGYGGVALYNDVSAAVSGVHAPVTVADTDSVDLHLAGQLVTADVILAADGGLEIQTGSGLAAKWGTGHNEVPRGDHSHALLHAAATGGATNSATVSVDSGLQQITCDVRRDPNPDAGDYRVGESSAGLYVVGSGIAPANHTHQNANASVDGFMPASMFARVETLLAASSGLEQVVTWNRESALAVSDYVGGPVRFASARGLARCNGTAFAPVTNTVLTLLVDGVGIGAEVTIPSGLADTEVEFSATWSGLAIAANAKARWRCASGPSDVSQAARFICVALNLG